MRGLFEENPPMKNCGSPWKEGIVKLEVDKWHLNTGPFGVQTTLYHSNTGLVQF